MLHPPPLCQNESAFNSTQFLKARPSLDRRPDGLMAMVMVVDHCVVQQKYHKASIFIKIIHSGLFCLIFVT